MSKYIFILKLNFTQIKFKIYGQKLAGSTCRWWDYKFERHHHISCPALFIQCPHSSHVFLSTNITGIKFPSNIFNLVPLFFCSIFFGEKASQITFNPSYSTLIFNFFWLLILSFF